MKNTSETRKTIKSKTLKTWKIRLLVFMIDTWP